MTTAEKVSFLQNELIPLLRSIPAHTPAGWGKMNVQQMIEHLGDATRMASGRLPAPRVFTPEADLPKMQAFLMSDKPFPPNIINPLMPETPAPVRFESIEAALAALEKQIHYFFATFEANPNLTTVSPFFGVLDFEGNVQLMWKHSKHHLKQFGVEVMQPT